VLIIYRKLILLLGLLTWLLHGVVQAQSSVPPPRLFGTEDEKIFHGGLSVGGNVSEVIGDAYHGFHKVGWRIGPGVIGKFSNSFGIDVELLYAQKGSRGVKQMYSSIGDYFENYFLKLHYVEVPIQLLVFPTPRTHIGVGFSYARLIKSEERVETMQPLYNFNQDDYPFLKDDWCGLASVHYQFWKGWFIGAAYSRSLRPIRKADTVPPHYGSGHQYNTYFSFTLRYLIP